MYREMKENFYATGQTCLYLKDLFHNFTYSHIEFCYTGMIALNFVRISLFRKMF